MDAVLASKQFTSDKLCRINYCRLYLQAITISDILIAGGSRLDPYFLKGSKGPMSSITKLHHVNQARPNKISWNLWKKANYLWTSQGTKPKQTLGRWLVPADKLRRSWKAYLNPSSQELLLRYNDQHYNIHPSHHKGFQLQCDRPPIRYRPNAAQPLYWRDPKHGQSEQPRLFSSYQNKPHRAKALSKHL